MSDHIGADGVFTTCYHKINMNLSKPLHIIPIGDVHCDSPAHCRDTWLATLERIKQLDKDKEHYVLLGMGDMVDFASTSERAKLSRQGELHESTHASLDAQSDSTLTKFMNDLWFTRGKWIGFIQGNHYWRTLTGKYTGHTTEMTLAEKLGGKWLGAASYIILSLQLSKKMTSFDIFASHGKSGGQLLGTPYNNVHKMKGVFPDADAYLMGHDHNRGAITKTILKCKASHTFGDPVVKERKQVFGRTGSFLKAYQTDEPNYVVRSLMSPSDLGHIEIILKVSSTSKGKGQGRVLVKDVKVIS